MSYLIIVLYLLSFFLTLLLQKKIFRFLSQFFLLVFIIALDAYVYYNNMLLEASNADLDWDWPNRGRERWIGDSWKVDLQNYTFFEHFSDHHYIYVYVVFFMMLSIFHFGGRLFDYYKESSAKS